ncbi:MAG: hypothetical protein CM1200mP24_02340 [Gammaproteobacteria bacterium]|nr:MAG: hypothetical protein CM1200mP24_02340 [Gammaproteobacteria bacterium]
MWKLGRLGGQHQVLYNRTRPRAERLAKKYRIAEITQDWREAINRPDIDIVSVSMPNNLHYEISMAAIEAGKHIFCEKPLAMNFVEAKAMWAAARDRGNLKKVCNSTHATIRVG